MTQFAGRATFPAAFTDARGNGRGGLSITVYHRPTYLDGVTNGTALLLSATAEFESSNEGLAITGEDIAPSTTIEEYLSPTSVLLSQPATGSGTGRSFQVIGRQRAEDLATVYTDRTKGVADANPFVADSAGNAWPYLDPGDYDAVTVHGITPFTVLRDPGEPVAESDLAFAIATQGELDAEAATRSAEVAALTAADATETAARIAADSAEATTRAAADTAEASARAAADALKADVPYPGTPGTAVVTAAAATQDVAGKPAFAFALVKGYPWHDPYSYDRTIGQGDAAADTAAVQAALAACGTRGRLRLGPLSLSLTTGLVIPLGVMWDQDPECTLTALHTGVALTFDGGGSPLHGGQDGKAVAVRLKRAVAWTGADTTSVGVRILNTYYTDFHIMNVVGFHTGVEVRGDGVGNVGNVVRLGYLVNNKRGVVFSGVNGGWANQSTFLGGGIRIDSQHNGGSTPGTRYLVVPDNVNGHEFINLNLEGNAALIEKAVECAGRWNLWDWCRLEALVAGQFHFTAESAWNRVRGGVDNIGPGRAPFLDEGSSNIIEGLRGVRLFADASGAGFDCRATTSNGNILFNGTDLLNRRTFYVNGNGEVGSRLAGQTEDRVRLSPISALPPGALGGVEFGLGTAPPDVAIGRTATTAKGIAASCPIIKKVVAISYSGGFQSIDPGAGDVFVITLGANLTAMGIGATPGVGTVITFEFVQDATGSRTYAFDANCRFAGGSAPAPSTAPNVRDVFTFRWSGVRWFEQSRALGVAA